jgi:selenocysteine lyase/cysteine desulfurase
MSLSRRTFLSANAAALSATLLPSRLLAAVEAKTPAIPRLDDWNSVRRQFHLSPEYLHFAGFFIASHPEPVRAAIDGWRRAIDENPFLTVEGGLFEGEAKNLQVKVCREVAEYLGGKPSEIALTANTTTSLALVYLGLPLKAGQEVLVTTHDHVVHHEAIRLATERNGASVRKVALYEDPADASVSGIVSRVREAIRPQTRVLGMTWVHSSTGVRLPVRQIAQVLKEANARRSEADHVLLVVDGVHGIGAVDETIAEMGCDFFCAGTHKWMFAPRGTGILWGREERWALLKPVIPSFSNPELFRAWTENRPPNGPNTADRVTPGGFQAFEHQWAMGAAFRMHQTIGRARVADRIATLNARIKEGLASIKKVKLHTPRKSELSAGICCFEVDGQRPKDLVAKLLGRKIIASTSPYAVSYARLSAGLMNTPEEVDRAISAVRGFAGA